MNLTRQVVVFDAADVAEVSTFWAALLGGRVIDEDDRFHCVINQEGHWVIGVQHAPNHRAPDWPDGNAQQVHLDFHVTDPVASLAHAREVGARALSTDCDPEGGEGGFQVFADPAGHPFCIGWGHPTHEGLARYLENNPPATP